MANLEIFHFSSLHAILRFQATLYIQSSYKMSVEAGKPRIVTIESYKRKIGMGFCIPSSSPNGEVYPIVNEIMDGSVAEASGIKENDRILAVNGVSGSCQDIVTEFQKIFLLNKDGGVRFATFTLADEDCYNSIVERSR